MSAGICSSLSPPVPALAGSWERSATIFAARSRSGGVFWMRRVEVHGVLLPPYRAGDPGAGAAALGTGSRPCSDSRRWALSEISAAMAAD